MKKGAVIGIVIAVVLIIAAGIYFYYSNSNSSYTPTANPPSTVTPAPITAPPASATPASSAQSHAVTISNYAFSPATLTINVGDTVVWTNTDYVDHKIASDSPSNELASAALADGDTYSHTFTTAGTYAYHCTIHTSMKGTIIVQ